MHTNMAGVVPADVSTALGANVLGPAPPPPSGLSADEQRTYEQLNFFYTTGPRLRATDDHASRRRSTGSRTRPVGLAAWMINHDAASYSDIAAPSRGTPSAT